MKLYSITWEAIRSVRVSLVFYVSLSLYVDGCYLPRLTCKKVSRTRLVQVAAHTKVCPVPFPHKELT